LEGIREEEYDGSVDVVLGIAGTHGHGMALLESLGFWMGSLLLELAVLHNEEALHLILHIGFQGQISTSIQGFLCLAA
jgi:hypothetical protein